MSTILFPDSIGTDHRVGGKARALARLRECDVCVPGWFVVLPGESSPGGLFLSEAMDRLEGSSFAVRSSAQEEDGGRYSFAGQLESFLSVPAPEVPDRIQAVRKSAGAETLRAYREATGAGPAETGADPAVIVQEMIQPETSGVAFSADPVSGKRDTCVIAAVRGTADDLVSGRVNADTWKLEGPDGEIVSHSPSEGAPPISDDRVREIAAVVTRLEHHFQSPQDVEWAVRSGKLFILQSRPITALQDPSDSEGALTIWDNSNIIESYSGVTTPLTYSFARRAYENVYRQFCRLMAVPPSRLRTADRVFENMIGLVRGRIYYDLINWYRVLAMLPGFRINRGFMEQMMGVKEPMPEEVVASVQEESSTGAVRDSLHLAATLAGLLWNHVTLRRRAVRFRRRLEDALSDPEPPLNEMHRAELASYYRATESRLLTKWDAPIVNDFFAMIYFGVLRKLAVQWAGDASGSLANRLVRNTEGMVSMEPVLRIRAMAAHARDDRDLLAFLKDPSPSSMDPGRRLREFPRFSKEFDSYIAKFGDRCLQELKLESETLRDNPRLLLQSIAAAAECSPLSHRHTAPPGETQDQIPEMHPLKKRVFESAIRLARDRIRDRENLRFERTRVFGLVRRIMLEIGTRFAREEALEEPRDIFYLRLQEILEAAEAAGPLPSFKSRVVERREEFDRYRDTEAPPDRFETRGPPDLVLSQAAPASISTPDSVPASLAGIGCCAGKVRGRVRVVHDPANVSLRQGEILVARQTDPGWVMLFTSAAGLLVERGSLLSHSAIVSREMGLPAVVALPALTAWLHTGDFVEMDGATGCVRKIDPEETS